MPPTELSRRALIRMGLAGAGVVALPSFASACSSSSKSTAPSTTAPSTTVAGGSDALLAAAKREGSLNLIAISDSDESAYGPLLDAFKASSGLKVNLAEPLAGSGMEVDTVREQKGKAAQPDVIDVGMSYAIDAAKDGLLVRSLPDGWTDVPSAAKDPDGLWVSTYYGVMGIVSNPALLDGKKPPATPADLKKLPEGAMGFPGDPRTTEAAGPLASAASFAAVWKVALALGGSFDDIGPGIDFFAELADDGIFDPGKLGITEVMSSGDVAVTMLNNFDFARTVAQMSKKGAKAAPEMRIIPADAFYPSFYAQCAVKGSPHPKSAQLWLAFLLSDAGARAFLQGGAIPTRFPALYAAGTLGASDLGRVGELGLTAERLAKQTVPIPAQVDAAQKLVNERWGPDVKGE
jgi:putative spermidine/putrescine transport system substrate-binding protein